MKTLTTSLPTLLLALVLTTPAQAATMVDFPGRVALGSDAVISGFTGFFSNGFVQGTPSHNNVLSFDDGVVKMDLDVTVEGFDESGPAGLRTTGSAVGVDGLGDSGSESTRIDAGESIKVTFNDVAFSVIGAPPAGFVDPGSFEALMSTIRLAAFDAGTDTFTYAGIGAGFVVGDDTDTIGFVPSQPVDDGDMFTITADSGAFRALYVSVSGNYKVVPEPTTIGLIAVSALAMAVQRRSR